jgi:5'(3')-deoxyribonucleotidase
MNPTVAVDVDDVVLDLMNTWLSVYNLEFGDDLEREHIRDWDVSKFVKKEAKEAIYDYVADEDVFLASAPIVGALEGIQTLKKNGIRVIYVTANNPKNCKETWLKDHGFLEDVKDFVHAHDKSLINAEFLVDDNFNNCNTYKQCAILFNAPWNASFHYPFRVNNWDEIVNMIFRLMHKDEK